MHWEVLSPKGSKQWTIAMSWIVKDPTITYGTGLNWKTIMIMSTPPKGFLFPLIFCRPSWINSNILVHIIDTSMITASNDLYCIQSTFNSSLLRHLYWMPPPQSILKAEMIVVPPILYAALLVGTYNSILRSFGLSPSDEHGCYRRAWFRVLISTDLPTLEPPVRNTCSGSEFDVICCMMWVKNSHCLTFRDAKSCLNSSEILLGRSSSNGASPRSDDTILWVVWFDESILLAFFAPCSSSPPICWALSVTTASESLLQLAVRRSWSCLAHIFPFSPLSQLLWPWSVPGGIYMV